MQWNTNHLGMLDTRRRNTKWPTAPEAGRTVLILKTGWGDCPRPSVNRPTFHQLDYIYANMDDQWNVTDKRKPKVSEKNLPQSSTTNPTWSWMGRNQGLWNEKPVTNPPVLRHLSTGYTNNSWYNLFCPKLCKDAGRVTLLSLFL